MAYTKQTWVDGDAGGTPLSAARLNYMETGVDTAHDAADAAAASVVTDHGALTGLADDDHPQYHTDARGDARYYTKAQSDAAYAPKTGKGCRARLGAVQSIPHNTSTAVAFDTEDFDQGGFWTVGAPTRLTVPTGLGGLYAVTFSVSFAPSGTGTIREALVRVNGTSFIGSANAFPISAAVVCQGNGATAWSLAAGDYLELMIKHDVGAAHNAEAGVVRNVLELHRIGD